MLFTDFQGDRWVRPAVLQPGIHHEAGAADGEVQVQVPLVLLRGVRGVCEGRPDLHLQLGAARVQCGLGQWRPSHTIQTDLYQPVETGGHPVSECPVNLFLNTCDFFLLKLHGIHSGKNHLQITREDRYCQYYYKCKFGFMAVDSGYCIPF